MMKKIITSVFLAGIVFSLQAGKKEYKELLIDKQKKDVVTGAELKELQKKTEKNKVKIEALEKMYAKLEELTNALIERIARRYEMVNEFKDLCERYPD